MKNVKGFIGLFAGLAAIVLIILAFFVGAETIVGSSVALPGKTGVILALIAAVLGIVAIVFGVMSRKDKDKKGPRKAGVIIGIIAIIIALFSSATCFLTHTFVNYANGKTDQKLLDEMDEGTRKDLDKLVDQIRAEYPAK